MAQTVIITLTVAGVDTGPFSLYSNADAYVTPFVTGITRAALLAGYTSSVVPNGATIIRVKSTNVCTNYDDLSIITTTTTTSTTSTTTTAPPTTTTTTTAGTTTTTSTTTIGPATFSGSFVIHNASGSNTINVTDVSTSPLFTGSSLLPGASSTFTVSGTIPNGGHMAIRITTGSTMTITSDGIVATNTSKSTTGNGTGLIQITLTPSSFPNSCAVSGETDVTTP